MTFDPFMQATTNPWLQGLGIPYGFTQSPYGVGPQSPFGNIPGLGGLQNVLTGLTGVSPFAQIGSPWTHHLFSQLSPQTWLGGQQLGQFGSPYGTGQFGSPYGVSPYGSPFGGVQQQFGSPFGVSPLALLLPQLLQQTQYGAIPPQALGAILPQVLSQITQNPQLLSQITQNPQLLSQMTQTPQLLAQIGQNPIISSLLRTNPLLGGMHGGYPFI